MSQCIIVSAYMHRRLYPVMIYAPTRGGYVLTGVVNLYTDGIHFLSRQMIMMGALKTQEWKTKALKRLNVE